MKNLCLSALPLAATVLSSTAQAQVINGDLNHNDGLDVEDITLLIGGYLSGETEVIETSSNYYKEDNSLVVGTWYASKTSSIVFEADGTYGGGFPYKFIPAQGEILMFDNYGNVVDDFRVIYLTDEVMVIKRNDGTYLKMTRTIPPQRVTSITLSATELSVDLDGYEKLTATVLPSDADNPSVVWSSSDETVATVSQKGMVEAVGEGTATITCTAADGSGVQATCSVMVFSKPSNDHEAVDLGLSVKWATMNVGANAPEEYGDYFAWGETEPKKDYSWETYQWCNGSEDTMTKYCTSSDYGTVDNKTVLDLEDDAAHANWGGTWRMPTLDEIKELWYYCSWVWTTLNGVYGRKVTGPNGNSIFLPAAGFRSASSLVSAGSDGYYWSSSLRTDDPLYGWYLYFNSSNFRMYNNYRCYGRSVRAVCQ